jgi:hypothetical protein
MAVALALALGGLAWILNQGAGYPLVKVVCANGEKVILTWIAAGAMVLAVCGTWNGLRGRRQERFRFLASVAIGFNALVMLYVLLTATFPYILSPCE